MRSFLRSSLYVVATSLFGMLFACTDNPEYAGGIWDETQNGLAVHLVDSLGAPVVKARVRVINSSSWSSLVFEKNTPVVDSAITDSSGVAYLAKPSFAAYVEVEASNGFARSALASGDSVAKDTLRAPASLTGVIKSAGGAAPSEVYLFGTSYKARVSSTGEFSFDSLPAGDYAVLSAGDSGFSYLGSSSLESSIGSIDTLCAFSKDSVLFDDFEDASGASPFHALTNGSWWYTVADSSSSVIPALPENGLIKSSESWNGTQSLHESFLIDSTAVNPYALCGFDIGISRYLDASVFYDMSGVDSMTFYAKGSGHILMQFNGYSDLTGMVTEWDYEFDLSTKWTRLVILPSGNEAWEHIKARMSTITFLSTSGADLWLDNIVFHGISAEGLYSGLLRSY
ncbi:MAG: carboxypeptidase-like regulatory domain-containing protein [Fibrobacteraceae bacterium]|nr:carboxypeptidase-like regulatory domain-containing protein [Fibrobacteraceae bacterium]